MADGDDVAVRGVCVRLHGETATESDVGALRSWLEREQALDELVRSGRLQLQERSRTDDPEPGSPMGVGMEIFAAVVGGVTSVVVRDLLDAIGRAAQAWRDNRRGVEEGEPPEVRLESVGEDEPEGTAGPENDPPAARADG
ncbi:hypothetical protein [Streptomyces sp. NPDC006610]|jgi:hypothetical protein|uniref:hypothetical protein n=1 Tax=Streptomyces sp. NPDC006610 TaxID=3154584 RepID=UPI0033A66800